MKQLFFAVVISLGVALSASAQHFNARQGYIFEQKFVSRITTSAASRLTGISNIDGEFFALYDTRMKARDAALPKGTKRVGDTIFLEAPGKPKLSLTDFVNKKEENEGDSQRFSYLTELVHFHVLSVEFDHDRPCFLLVSKETLEVFFIDY